MFVTYCTLHYICGVILHKRIKIHNKTMEKEEKHIGNMVRQAIEDSGCTLSEVARNVGISRQCLNGWLKRDDMSVKQLYLISEFLCDKLLDYYFLKQKVCLSCKIKDDTINNLNELIKLKNENSTSEKIKDFDTRELAEKEACLLAEDICKQFKI